MSISTYGYSYSLCEDSAENSCCCSELNEMSSCDLSLTKIQLTKKCGCEEIALNELYRDKHYLIVSNQSSLIFTNVNSILNYNNCALSETLFVKKDFISCNIGHKIFIAYQNLRI
jgi:hypothetical protein